MVPKYGVVNEVDLLGWWLAILDFSDSLIVENVVFAVVDHLVGDLDEETSHGVVGVVVSGDGVDHLDGVHQGRQGVLDCLRCAFV